MEYVAIRRLKTLEGLAIKTGWYEANTQVQTLLKEEITAEITTWAN
jgi:hypothetical protein